MLDICTQFGCTAYPHVSSERHSKLDSKTTKRLFLGYCDNSKACQIYDKISRKLIISRDVIFYEETNEGPIKTPGLSLEKKSEETILENPKPDPEDQKSAIEESKGQQSLPQESRSQRTRKPPGEWWKVSSNQGQNTEHANLACLDAPSTVSEALEGPDARNWEEAMDSEMESILKNDTWTLTELPPGRKPIGCKWIFRLKLLPDGTVERYKARLVAKGFAQQEGVDFNETFAPVAKFTSIRLILAIAVGEKLFIHQMDVKTAFLYGFLKELVFMTQPEGYIQKSQEHLFCKLHRSLYGLKQAPRAWYSRIDIYLCQLGFKRSVADHGIYVKVYGDVKIILALYVDDLLILCNKLEVIFQVKADLSKEFEMTDLGEAKFILGIYLEQNIPEGYIRLNQSGYIAKILERFKMEDSNPVSTPLDVSVKLCKNQDPPLAEMKDIPYQSAVGSLMYAMIATRPDIAAAVGVVCRFMSNPTRQHWTAVKRILRYLKGTKHFSLQYQATGDKVKLTGYSDSNWAGDLDTRRSTTGYTFLVNSGSISWSSKIQTTVALSTTEAEYMALSETTKEVIWLRQLLSDLGYQQQSPTTLYVDNQSTISLAKNPVMHARTKHIDICHHFIREHLDNQDINLEYINTADMIADILTKPLTGEKHKKNTLQLGLKDL